DDRDDRRAIADERPRGPVGGRRLPIDRITAIGFDRDALKADVAAAVRLRRPWPVRRITNMVHAIVRQEAGDLAIARVFEFDMVAAVVERAGPRPVDGDVGAD